MPELPEVETVMRGLAGTLAGKRIARITLRRPDLRRAFPPDLVARLTGARITGFARRAKYILMQTDRGDAAIIHLGMSGRMVLARANRPPEANPHEHVVIETEDGWRVGFVDPRRFGSLDLVRADEAGNHPAFKGLGPEPLDAAFTPAALSAALAGRRTSIKAALMDQRIVAGLGNIYVCEALFRAGISPRRAAGTVAGARAARLVPAIKAVLEAAIRAGGSSLRDHVQPNGELGYFQHAWAVYGREGEPCPGCPGPPGCKSGIRRMVQGGRSTFYCPTRQT
ncbi:MAG: bifunctional DNA-formamidopyrimidine glycosylase/DNA-(apurinic or apyrimidinic site) lyase [Alphaproteobacteria bacterium]|nr:bifunctional DNA-formamidopyrimidine glycosylase/DNA-(apurinic or apyrimidinic site) lyase [Alphaproteobacteria bacterium]